MNLLVLCAVAVAVAFVGSMPLAGPVAVMVVSRAANGKFDEALRVGFGAAVAEGIYAAVAFVGYTSLFGWRAGAIPISRGATAIVLGGVGAYFMFWRRREKKGKPENKAGTVLLGFSLSAANPTLLLTWSAVVAFLYSKGMTRPTLIAAIPLGFSVTCGVTGWFCSLTMALRKYGGRVPERALTWAVRGMGALLVALGAWSGVDLVRWFHQN